MFGTKKLEPAENIVTFNQEDNCFERARKLWQLMGFMNDRLGQCSLMAEGIAAYMKQDAQAFKIHVDKPDSNA